jgi:hypothetical protein
MPFVIPVDAHLITLQVSGFRIEHVNVQVGRVTQVQARRVEDVHEVVPRINEKAIRQGFDRANQIWDIANVKFFLRSLTPEKTPAPNNADVVDENGFFFLARQFPPKSGVSLLLVDKFKSKHLGGMSVETLKSAIIPYLVPPDFGNILAHEMGHLLGLLDLTDDHYNLMYQSYRADYKLSSSQVAKATSSALAKQFGHATP